MSQWLPPPAARHAPAIDAVLQHVHEFVLILAAGWAIYFVYVLIRFRSSRQPVADPAGAKGRIAMFVFAAVVIAEAVLLVGFALPLWYERAYAGNEPGNPLVLRVVAEQFVWNVHYPGEDGQFGEASADLITPTNPLGLNRKAKFGRDDLVILGEMHLPVDRSVVIQLTSKDVIHSFGVPAMRVKQDVTPGLRTRVWFTPTLIGDYEIVCSQLCGLGHHRMRGVIKVESAEAYLRFLADEAKLQAGK